MGCQMETDWREQRLVAEIWETRIPGTAGTRHGEGPSPPGGCSHQQVDLLLCKNSGKVFPLLQATLACLCFEDPVTSCFCSTTRGPLTILASLEVGVVGGR